MSDNPIPPNNPPPKAFLVRFGAMRIVGEFGLAPGSPETLAGVGRGSKVLLRTDRGTELGEVLCAATPQAIAALPEPIVGELLRPLGPADDAKYADLDATRRRELAKADELVVQHRLLMQLIDMERLWGNERVIFYFLSENRVDFRELVKSMAREFKSRIELRQVGVRDEAKLLADFGDCGKPVCCNTHMAVMPPVNMRMAKLQKATLDPNKISGRCGRLKCCLRFEQDVYEEFQLELPAIGSRVVTDKGQGRVLAQEILAKRLLIEFEDGRRMPVNLADVLTRL